MFSRLVSSLSLEQPGLLLLVKVLWGPAGPPTLCWPARSVGWSCPPECLPCGPSSEKAALWAVSLRWMLCHPRAPPSPSPPFCLQWDHCHGREGVCRPTQLGTTSLSPRLLPGGHLGWGWHCPLQMPSCSQCWGKIPLGGRTGESEKQLLREPWETTRPPSGGWTSSQPSTCCPKMMPPCEADAA